MKINGAPTEGTTANYSFYVAADDSRFNGDVIIADDIYSTSTSGNLIVSGGSAGNLGFNTVWYGESHASKAGDGEFRDGSTVVADYDKSASTWGFRPAGTLAFSLDADEISGATSGSGVLLNVATSTTIPSLVPDGTDRDTGIGGDGSNGLALIAGGVNAFSAAPTQLTSNVDHVFSAVVTASPSNVTLSGDAFTASRSFHKVSGEGGSADDIVTINGGSDGDILYLRANDGAVTITVKSTGNIDLQTTGGDFAMDNAGDMIHLIYDSGTTKWHEVARSDNGA